MITIKDASNATVQLATSVSGGQHTPVHSVSSSALPTGAATETSLAAVKTAVELMAKLTDVQPVTDEDSNRETTQLAISSILSDLLTELEKKADPAEAQSVTVTSSTLPTGAATESTLAQVLTAVNLRANRVSGKTANITNTASTEVIAAPVSPAYHCITRIDIGNASSTATWVKVLSGSTHLASYFAAAQSQISILFDSALPLTLAAGEALNAQCETTSSETRVNAVGYTL